MENGKLRTREVFGKGCFHKEGVLVRRCVGGLDKEGWVNGK